MIIKTNSLPMVPKLTQEVTPRTVFVDEDGDVCLKTNNGQIVLDSTDVPARNMEYYDDENTGHLKVKRILDTINVERR